MNVKQTNGSRRSRVVATTAVLVVAVASLAMSGVASGADDDVDDDESIISVSFEAATSEGDECASAEDALSLEKQTTDDTYAFVVTVSTKLCDPIDAKAAAYAMPDNRGWPWPQKLVETEDVTFEEAGVTTITFAKACDPIQFDLFTGASPNTISPTGAHHGPLVFPHTNGTNTNGSAYQFWPSRDDCVEPTSSTSTPESSSTTTSTSEPPVFVSPETTLPTEGGGSGPGPNVGSGGAGSGANPGATVGGVQATRSPQSAAALSVAG